MEKECQSEEAGKKKRECHGGLSALSDPALQIHVKHNYLPRDNNREVELDWTVGGGGVEWKGGEDAAARGGSRPR